MPTATINCANCGNPFVASRADAKYCTNTCAKAASRVMDKVQKAIEKVEDLGYTIRRASDLAPTTYITTGHTALDELTGGFPRKRITEIYGNASVGKTTLMLQTISSMDKNLKVLYIDTENALAPEWLEQLGIDTSWLDVADPILLEDAANLVLKSLPHYDLIVFDSVGAVLFKTEEANDIGTSNIGVKAKLMTSFMRKLIGPLSRSEAAMVFINQQKEVIGNMYGPQKYTPGGKALEYASSLRLELVSNKADRVTKDGEKVGKKVTAKITKNKVGTPDREAQFLITY